MSFQVYYRSDWYANVCDITTAPDSDHQGFYVYRYGPSVVDGSMGWQLIQTINSTATNLTSEYITGNEVDLSKPHRITAFNAEGESTPLEWMYSPPPQSDPIIDLAFTRTGSMVVLTWTGTLVNGDAWTVKLLDPAGYGNDEISTTTENNATVQTGLWQDRTIEVYSTQNPANLASLAIPHNRPDLTAPALLSVIREGAYNTLTVEFSSDWLQSAHEEGLSYDGTVYYSVAGDDSSSFSNGVESLGNSQFRTMADVPLPPDGEEYQVTLELTAGVFGTAPRPMHVLANAPVSVLTGMALTLFVGATGAITPSVLTIHWTVSATPLALEIETRVDGMVWQPTLTTEAINGQFDAWLHGKNDPTGLLDQTGPLDIAHGYRYSDGKPSQGTSLHTVEARARKAGSSDAWLEAVMPAVLPLRSKYYPFVDWTINRQYANAVSWDSPFFMGTVPVEMRREWHFSVDGEGDYAVEQAAAWLAQVPREALDGASHEIQFTATLINTVDSQVISVIPTANRLVSLPTAADLEIPETPYQTNLITEYDGSFSLVITGLSSNAITAVNDESGPVAFTARNVGTNAILEAIELPQDGLTHGLTITVHRENVLTGFEKTQAVFTAIKMSVETPASPNQLTAELLRQATRQLPDQVRLSWPAGLLVQLVAVVHGRLLILGYADSTTNEVMVEDLRKSLKAGSGLNAVRFGVRGFALRALGSVVLSNEVLIQALPAPPAPPVLDPVINQATFLEELFDEQEVDSFVPLADVENIVKTGLSKIKTLLAQGGHVSLNGFGIFKAVWKNGERQANFTFDSAFKRSVVEGVVIP
ncbi:MAG: hypothetical protein H6975_03655 [Gammaproteobacteria bacterium]|nr:hypothetical protein [Gammaproteobacteria bacterium]